MTKDELKRERLKLLFNKAQLERHLSHIKVELQRVEVLLDEQVYKDAFPGYVSHRSTGRVRLSPDGRSSEYEWIVQFEDRITVHVWCQSEPLARQETVLKELAAMREENRA